MEIVYSKNQHAWVPLAEIPHASGKMWTNEEKKMSDKEVRTACCKQRAPDVKDIQISAQNTLPYSFQITGDTRVWKKKHQKQNSCYTTKVLCSSPKKRVFSTLETGWTSWKNGYKAEKKVSQLEHQVKKGILKKIEYVIQLNIISHGFV